MRPRKQRVVGVAAMVVVLLLLAGCGGGGDGGDSGDAPASQPPQTNGGGDGGDTPANRPPRANAGPDQTVAAGSVVMLIGSGSDPDGKVARYQWAQTGGSAVSLSPADMALASFTAPDAVAVVTLTFRLTVTDDDSATASDDVSVTIRPAAPSKAFVVGMNRLDDPGFRLQ